MRALLGGAIATRLPETLGACLGGAFLAGVMHVPLGTALLVQRMSGCDAHGLTMLIVANYIACFLNPLTIFKQEPEEEELFRAADGATKAEATHWWHHLFRCSYAQVHVAEVEEAELTRDVSEET